MKEWSEMARKLNNSKIKYMKSLAGGLSGGNHAKTLLSGWLSTPASFPLRERMHTIRAWHVLVLRFAHSGSYSET